MSAYLTEISLLVFKLLMDLTPFLGQIPRVRSVFSVGLCATLWKPPQLRIEFTHLTVLLDFQGNTHLKKNNSFCKTVYMLVVNATSVCKLVSALCLEFTQELQVIINVLLFSEVIVVVGRGHRGRAYRSVSKAFWAEGGKWVMCGFAFIVFFTKVIVLFCIVV